MTFKLGETYPLTGGGRGTPYEEDDLFLYGVAAWPDGRKFAFTWRRDGQAYAAKSRFDLEERDD